MAPRGPDPLSASIASNGLVLSGTSTGQSPFLFETSMENSRSDGDLMGPIDGLSPVRKFPLRFGLGIFQMTLKKHKKPLPRGPAFRVIACRRLPGVQAFFEDTKWSLWWLPEVNNMCRVRALGSRAAGEKMGVPW